MFHTLKLSTKLGFVPQTFCQDQNFTFKFNTKSYVLFVENTHRNSFCCTNFLAGPGSRFYFTIQYQNYISYIKDISNLVPIRKLLQKLLCPQTGQTDRRNFNPSRTSWVFDTLGPLCVLINRTKFEKIEHMAPSGGEFTSQV